MLRRGLTQPVNVLASDTMIRSSFRTVSSEKAIIPEWQVGIISLEYPTISGAWLQLPSEWMLFTCLTCLFLGDGITFFQCVLKYFLTSETKSNRNPHLWDLKIANNIVHSSAGWCCWGHWEELLSVGVRDQQLGTKNQGCVRQKEKGII